METIRKYEEKDKDLIRTICMDTANKRFNEKPGDREAICNMYIDYFIDFEPENAFVCADENDIACGYIVCSTNKKLYNQKHKDIYLKKIFKRSFLLWFFAKISLTVSNKLNVLYNGGFHININATHQKKGLGSKLITALAKHIKNTGHKYIYLVTENRKTRGYGFYKHYGFKEANHFLGGSMALTYNVNNIKA